VIFLLKHLIFNVINVVTNCNLTLSFFLQKMRKNFDPREDIDDTLVNKIILGLIILFVFGCLIWLLYLVIKNYMARRSMYVIRQPFYERVMELTYNSSNPLRFSQINCAICLQNFKNGQILHGLPCGHSFDRKCMSIYILENDICPICRKIILS
jgi:ABC-type multidrug transport system fused ATPase/permease subunit